MPNQEKIRQRIRDPEFMNRPFCVKDTLGSDNMKKILNQEKIKQLKLQNVALRAYYKYHGESYRDHLNEKSLMAWFGAGDTLPLFLWREIGDACGDPQEAHEMLERVQK